jgi:folate-binding protein YgfZ
VVERVDIVRLRVWGQDPERMLNGLLTNDLARMTPERAVYAALLTPKGKMISDGRVIPSVTEGSTKELRLDVPKVALPALTEHFNRFLPPRFARWEVVEGQTFGVYGPHSGALLNAVFGMAPQPDEDSLATITRDGSGISLISTGIAGVFGSDVSVGADQAEAVHNELIQAARMLDGGRCPFERFEVARIEAGRPRYGVDMTDETLPAEVFESIGQMERAVSFNKGCYTGQEVVVRIAHRGHVNRLLRGLLLGEAPSPPPGTPLVHVETGRPLGVTGSATLSPALSQTIAMGYVRREVSPGETVLVGDHPAVVADLPFRRSGQ